MRRTRLRRFAALLDLRPLDLDGGTAMQACKPEQLRHSGRRCVGRITLRAANLSADLWRGEDSGPGSFDSILR